MAKSSSHPYISVMGPTGCGKTTAAKLLADKLDFQLVTENFADNRFLPWFYQDMPRWAFHSQTFFLTEKIKQLNRIKQLLTKQAVVQDTPIYQDIYSYAQAHVELGNLKPAEWQLYQKIYQLHASHLPRPNLIIYLQASVDNLLDRIAQRDRSFEQKMPRNYLQLLSRLLVEWTDTELHPNSEIQLLTVDTNQLNLAESATDQNKFISLVKKQLKRIQKK